MIALAASGDDGREGRPDQSWLNHEIEAYAERFGIDLGGATRKADMLAVIHDAEVL